MHFANMRDFEACDNFRDWHDWVWGKHDDRQSIARLHPDLAKA